MPKRQFMVRVTEEQFEVLTKIAEERDFLGGSGRHPGEPNCSAAARWLMGQADQRFAKAAALEDRSIG